MSLLLALLIVAHSAAAGTYYVSTTGDDAQLGTSEDRPWRTLRHASSRVGPGDTVYVKAGLYRDDGIAPAVSGTGGAPIVFEGYQTVPGDMPRLGWEYPSRTDLDETVMPLIDGGDRTSALAIDLISRSYVTVQNFQVRGAEVGMYAYDSHFLLVDNVIAEYLGDPDADYDGFGLILSTGTTDSVLSNCVVYNAGAEAIAVVGDDNVIEDCRVYADDDSTLWRSNTDYYLDVYGENNIIVGNYVERVGDLDHGGHGIGVKEYGEGNVFAYNTAVNLSGGLYVRHSGVQNNTFENNTIRGGDYGILIRDGATRNVFQDNYVVDTEMAVAFMQTGEDETATVAGTDNTVQNTIIENVHCVFDFSYYAIDGAAQDNHFVNLTVVGADYLGCGGRENHDNDLVNSIVVGVDAYASDDPYEVELAVSDSLFFDSGFDLPVGEGNLTADPLFVDRGAGDFHLMQESPARDIADPEVAPPEDYDGESRMLDEGPDLGALEYVDDPGSSGGDDTGSSGVDDTGSSGVDDTGSSGADDTGSSGVDDTGPSGVDDTGPSGGDDSGPSEDSKSCGCSTQPSGFGSVIWPIVFVLGFGAGRRRRVPAAGGEVP